MTLRYIIDTDTFIYIKNYRPPQVFERFRTLGAGTVGISVITYGELFRGAERSDFRQRNHKKLQELVHSIPVQPMPEHTGLHYGKIRHDLEKAGKVIGNNDLWIAAHVLASNLTLITNNTKEFGRVDGLSIENWV